MSEVKHKKSKKLSKAGIGCIVAVSFLLVLVIVINVAFSIFASFIDQFLNTSSLSGAARSASKNLAEQIEAEGMVLVKNEENALPLNKENNGKANVFGWASKHWIKGGSGSGQASVLKVDFLQALSDYGIQTNTELSKCYDKFFADGREYESKGSLHSTSAEFSRLYEPKISDRGIYPESVLNNAKSFSPVAYVVLGRITGESNDCPGEQYKYSSTGSMETDSSRTYLDISTEEEALLTYVGANFGTVIVVVNSTNTMNLSFLDTIPGIDACIIAGATGAYGATSIPKVVYGELTPSGRVADTYAYDFASNPSYATAGLNGLGAYKNAENLYPYYVRNGNIGSEKNENFGRVSYIDYKEGIYVGYKWYETADAEGYWTENGVNHYKEVVQFPFGYGLSYTTFSWSVGEFEKKKVQNADKTEDFEITVKVEVTNTGERNGQDVVQLYYTPPYTAGGIEKSAVNLCDFAKTQILKPNEKQTLTLSFRQSDMASYDYNDANGNRFYGYEVEKGNYILSLRVNSHEEKSGGEITHGAATYTYNVAKDVKIQNDPVTGVEVKNRFTPKTVDKRNAPVDGVGIDGTDTGANIVYLSRKDFKGTFPTKGEDRDIPSKITPYNVDTRKWHNDWKRANGDVEEPTMGAKKGLKVSNGNVHEATELGLALGKDYNDPRWEQVLDQLTYNDMVKLVRNGTYFTEAIKSIGMPELRSPDGPTQFGSFGIDDQGDKTTGFPMPTVLAQTFSKELARSFGLSIANEAKQLNNYAGWYGPGVNLHRSPFGGRNYEYYSEDSYLSGIMCAETVKACKDGGIFCFIKHLALYNQDSYRDGVYTWLTEQNLRETYIKPFKIAIQQGGATALMTEYGRVGAVWAGGSTGLITSVIREELGFRGAIITDYADTHYMMSGDAMIRAGGDIWMASWTHEEGAFKFEKSAGSASNAFKQELRRATKNVIYAWLNALYTNSVYDPLNDTIRIEGASGGNFSLRVFILVMVNVLFVLGCGFWIFWVFFRKKVFKKYRLAAEAAQYSESANAPNEEEGERENKEEEPPNEQAQEEEQEEEREESFTFCYNCGGKVYEHEKRCSQCGAKKRKIKR